MLYVFDLVHESLYLHGCQATVNGMRVIGRGQPTGAHERIADGLQFLQVVTIGYLIKIRKAFVELVDHFFWAEFFSNLSETGKVGEQHAC